MNAKHVPWWVRVADGVTVVLLVLCVAVLFNFGFRLESGRWRFSVTDETRVLLWAVIVTGLRHFFVRRPNLLERMRQWWESPRMRRVRTRVAAEPPILAEDRVCLPREGAGAPRGRRLTGALEAFVIVAFFAAATIVMTYPQVRDLNMARDMGDPILSTWRLSWVAHQLPRDPLHLFDANIFYPERWTFAYTDAALLPALAAAPFMWLGAPPFAVTTAFVLVAMALAGICMYFFVRAVTGSRPAALVAGVAFAFYPYHFEHYSHFEHHFSFWMPLALWALHRVLASGRRRDGILLGLAIAGQYLSAMYLGIFLGLIVAVLAAAMALGWNRPWRALKPLLAGALVAGVIVAPTVVPYVMAKKATGERTSAEVQFYSATGQRYLVAHFTSALYGSTLGSLDRHGAETDLFPGILIVVLAAAAVWPPLSVTRTAYLLALLFAFEASFGLNGHVYPMLYKWLLPFRALRSPARLSMLVGLALSVLAGYGIARVATAVRRRWLGWALALAACVVIGLECRPVSAWEHVWPVPPIYKFFQGHPGAIVAELPTSPEFAPRDAQYMYFSIGTWHRLLNGYSGNLPKSWSEFSGAMTTFPDAASMALLRSRGTDYVVIHERAYGAVAYRAIVREAAWHMREVARDGPFGDEIRIFAVK